MSGQTIAFIVGSLMLASVVTSLAVAMVATVGWRGLAIVVGATAFIAVAALLFAYGLTGTLS